MPRLSLWAVRLSLLYLLAGFTIGALLLVNKGTGWNPGIWRWFAAHHEFLLFGWMGQFSLGVGYWAFPRYRGNHRGNPTLAVAAIVLLNLGVLLVFAAAFWGLPLLPWGRAAESLAGLSFAVYSWPRIKPIGPEFRKECAMKTRWVQALVLMFLLLLPACGAAPEAVEAPDVSGVKAAHTPDAEATFPPLQIPAAGPVRPGCGDYRLLVVIESDADGVGLRVSGPAQAVDVVWPLSGPGLAFQDPPVYPRTFTDDNREVFGVEGNEGHEPFIARFSLLVSGVAAGQRLQLEMGVESPGQQGTRITVYNARNGLTEPGEALLSVQLNEAYRQTTLDLCAADPMPLPESQPVLQPRLLAFFYPWWSTTAEPEPPYHCGGDDFGWIRATEAGVRAIVTAHLPIDRDGDTVIYRQTACWTQVADEFGRSGWIYDVQEPYFLAEQMALAQAFGLDGFALSVHGDNDYEMRFLAETALPVAEAQHFLLAPLYEMPEEGWSGNLERDRETVGEHLRALVEMMAQSPAALTVARNGQEQVVLFVDPAVLARFVLAEDWQVIREMVDEAGQPYFLWSGPAAFAWVFDGGLDGMYNDLDVIETYEAPLGLPPYSLRDERRLAYRAAAWAARERDMPLALPVVTGWEGAEAIRPEDYVPLTRDYGAPQDWGHYYRVRWEDALEAAPDWIVITSWNEWAEGTELEPSDVYPPSRFDYLQATWTYACAWQGGCP